MEPLKHECGVAMLRLRKPIPYYKKKYGTVFYGLEKLYQMMSKEYHRGQEGAGIGCVKIINESTKGLVSIKKATGSQALTKIFADIAKEIKQYECSVDNLASSFEGNCYLGHLRYSTTGKSGMDFLHPFYKEEKGNGASLMICGNFTLTNTENLIYSSNIDSKYKEQPDTEILLHYLYECLNKTKESIPEADYSTIVKDAVKFWDGGFVICGLQDNGRMWAVRDPHGIRTAFWYADDELIAIASERTVLQAVFNQNVEQINELVPGSLFTIDEKGDFNCILPDNPLEPRKCTFERIYFSKGNDREIYNERKKLGYFLGESLINNLSINFDTTVFSYVPNTAEVAFYGMLDFLEDELNRQKTENFLSLIKRNSSFGQLPQELFNKKIRVEKLLLKDDVIRTFIAGRDERVKVATRIYDVTYGIIKEYKDSIVLVDDSIVRGTTLKEAVLKILDRLHPKEIILTSSAPQIRYPDFYGIDMASLYELVAFRAAVNLLLKNDGRFVLDKIYEKCKLQEDKTDQLENYVMNIYEPFSEDQLTQEIQLLLKPEDIQSQIKIIYQPLKNLRKAIPHHTGDWYFTGNYPTQGGLRRLNEAFIEFYKSQFLR